MGVCDRMKIIYIRGVYIDAKEAKWRKGKGKDDSMVDSDSTGIECKSVYPLVAH